MFRDIAEAVRRVAALFPEARRRRLFLVVVLGIVGSALEVVATLLVLALLRVVLEPASTFSIPVIGDVGVGREAGSVTALAAAFGVVLLVRAFVVLVQKYWASRLVESAGMDLASELVAGYLAMPYEFHLGRNASELTRNAYDNVIQVVSRGFTPLMDILTEGTLMVAMVVVLVVASPLATAGAILLMGVTVLVVLLVVQPRAAGLGRRRNLAAERALRSLQESLGGIRDIKVLGREDTFVSSFKEARQEMALSHYWISALGHVPRLVIETVFLGAVLVVVAVAAANNAVSGTLSTLGLFAYVGTRLQPSLRAVTSSLNLLRYVESAAEAVEGDLAGIRVTEPDRWGRSDHHPLLEAGPIAVHEVSYSYPDSHQEVVRDVSVEVGRGQFVGLVGPTGSGKSTLLDLMIGLLTPSTGRVTVAGRDIIECGAAWTQVLGVVHQTSFLVDATLERNVAFGVDESDIDEEAMNRAIETAQLTALVDGLPQGRLTMVGQGGERLSGGERQRIAIARALYRRPSVLFLDEATSALDNETERRLLDGLRSFSPDMTIVAVAHRISALHSCDVIIHLEGGQLIGVGPHEELLELSPGYRALAGRASDGE